MSGLPTIEVASIGLLHIFWRVQRPPCDDLRTALDGPTAGYSPNRRRLSPNRRRRAATSEAASAGGLWLCPSGTPRVRPAKRPWGLLLWARVARISMTCMSAWRSRFGAGMLNLPEHLGFTLTEYSCAPQNYKTGGGRIWLVQRRVWGGSNNSQTTPATISTTPNTPTIGRR